mgnify:CR=1 FL=1
MTPEQAAAYVAAQTALLNCRVAGMQAENTHRVANGWGITYGEAAFEGIYKDFSATIGHNTVISLFRGAVG